MPPLSSSQLVSGTVLPPGTTLTGPIRGASQGISTNDPIPVLRFMIVAKLPRQTTAYDADQKGASVQRTNVFFSVYDAEWTKLVSPKSSDRRKAAEGRLKEACSVLAGLIKERKMQLEVDVGGMRVESREEDEKMNLTANFSFEGEVRLKHVDGSQGSDIVLLKSGKKKVEKGLAEWTTFDPPVSKHAGLSTAKSAPPKPLSKPHMPMSTLPVPVRPRGLSSGTWSGPPDEASSRPIAGEALMSAAPKAPSANPSPQQISPASRGPPGISRTPTQAAQPPVVKQSPQLGTPASRDPPGVYRTPTQAQAAHPIPNPPPTGLPSKRGPPSAVEDQAAPKRPRADEPARYIPPAAPAPTERKRTGQVVNKPPVRQVPPARVPVAEGDPEDAGFEFMSSSGVRYMTVNQLRACKSSSMVAKGTENVGVIAYAKGEPPELRQIGAGDFFFNLPLADETNVADENAVGEDIIADIFRKSGEALERIKAGTVILIRTLKLNSYDEKVKIKLPSGGGFSKNIFATMSDGVTAVPEEAALFRYNPLRDDEIARMRAVWAFANPSPKEGEEAAQGAVKLKGPKRKTIKEASMTAKEGSAEMDHFDGTFKILEVSSDIQSLNRDFELELYVTDGTIAEEDMHNRSWNDWGLPKRAVLIVCIENMPTEKEGREYLKKGNIVKMPNVNIKRHMETRELEAIWVPGFAQAELEKGYRPKKVTLIQRGQPAAQEIEQRIAKLRQERSKETEQKYMTESEGGPAGDVDDEPTEVEREKPVEPEVTPPTSIAEAVPQRARESPFQATPGRVDRQKPAKAAEPSDAAGPTGPREIATHLRTEYTSGSGLPVSTLKDIIFGTGPKAFRTIARVLRVFAPDDENSCRKHHLGDTLLVRFCKKDETEFGAKGPSCLTCGDVPGKNAEWRYRFFVLLEDDDGARLVVCVRDEEAERFLPALPPYTTTTGPNEAARTQSRLATATAEARDLFMGEEVDGVRSRPWIEFTLDAVLLKHPENGRQYLLYEMWGMRRG